VKEFEDFKHQIDTRGRYMCAMTGTEAIEPADFNFKMNWNVETALVQHLKNIDVIGENLDIIEVLTQGRAETQSGPRHEEKPLIPSLELKYDPEKRELYPEDHRTECYTHTHPGVSG
jgi:hypothetical protein